MSTATTTNRVTPKHITVGDRIVWLGELVEVLSVEKKKDGYHFLVRSPRYANPQPFGVGFSMKLTVELGGEA